jgi:hypothetical protein
MCKDPIASFKHWWTGSTGSPRYPQLHNLSEQEKRILRPFILEQQRVRCLGLDHETVAHLRSLYILGITQRGGPGSWHHQLSPWAWDYLNEHPELLDLVGEGG